MAIEYRCPVCHVLLHVSAGHTGSVRCHECASVFPMPDGRAVPDPGAPPVEFPKPRDEPKPEPPPPPPRGRALFYVVAAVAGLLVVGALGLLVWVLLPDRARWRTHNSAAGGFRIDFPAEPHEERALWADMGGAQSPRRLGCVFRKVKFAIEWGDLPTRLGPTDEEFIEWLGEGRIRWSEQQRQSGEAWAGDGSVVMGPQFTVSGFPARDLEFFRGRNTSAATRVVVADSRLYWIVVEGVYLDPQSPDVRRFLDSFKITDPAILGKAPKW
jgi:hypothetical protein